jgi:sugar/nucleoside kinase (ribokinase family)
VSIDTRGRYLHECLIAHKTPRFAFMNTEEFGELAQLLHRGDACVAPISKGIFSGTLLAHDERGCWVWDRKLPGGRDPFSEAEHFPSIRVPTICSTIGAGDAMHAGFLKEWICSLPLEERLRRAVVYSQVVAAVAVSSEKATHGIDACKVEDKFRYVWQGMRRNYNERRRKVN